MRVISAARSPARDGTRSLRDAAAISNTRHIALLEQARANLSPLGSSVRPREEFILAELQALAPGSTKSWARARATTASAHFRAVLYREMTTFDVIVIGAGHAGGEAAYAAARWGAASVSARSHVKRSRTCRAIQPWADREGYQVREIDASAVMGMAIDATGIQFKLLNRSRGPAVWSPRAQADKRRYAAWVTEALEGEPNISWIFGQVASLDVAAHRIRGIVMEGGERHACDALIVTTGTFLNGLIHVGLEQRPAGRHGEPPSRTLAESLKSFGFEGGRLKTGPPRLIAEHRFRTRRRERALREELGRTAAERRLFLTKPPETPDSCWRVIRTRGHDLVRRQIDHKSSS